MGNGSSGIMLGDMTVIQNPENICQEMNAGNESDRKVINDYRDALSDKSETRTKLTNSTIARVAIKDSPKSLYNGRIIPAISCYKALPSELYYRFAKGSFRDYTLPYDIPREGIKGQKIPDQKRRDFKTCNNKKYDVPPDAVQNSGHCEARLLSDLAAAGALSGAKLVLNVQWGDPEVEKKGRREPCRVCLKMICQVIDDCNVDIKMCSSNNELIDINKECNEKKKAKDKTGEEIHYKKLKNKLNKEWLI